MIYFTLPNTNNSIYKYIDCIFSDEVDVHEKKHKFDISNSLSFYLYEIKNKIKKYEREWDLYKKYTNPYEFINTVVPGRTKCIAKYKPLSRSYFKMIELLHFFFLDEFVKDEPFGGSDRLRGSEVEVQHKESESGGTREDQTDSGEQSGKTLRKPIHSFHLAEGPGGFIEALANTRNNARDVYVGITILESGVKPVDSDVTNKPGSGGGGKHNKSVPGWKKSDYFLKSHPNIYIETGADKTGNILSMDNFLHCRAKYGSSMDLITGDGGFDFSADFNNQETNITQLLFAQMCYALCLQKHGGSFVLKFFDCFMEHTVDILYILSAFYETVYITKPKTSRYANSEKYVVCKNFLLLDDSSIFPCLKMAFQKMLADDCENKSIYRFLRMPIPAYYIYKLEEYNTIYGQQQIENIYQTIVLIEQIRPEQEDQDRSGKASWGETVDGNRRTETYRKSREDRVSPELEQRVRKYSEDDFIQSSKINSLVRINIRKCVQWCLNHNIPYNIMDD